MEKEYDYNAKFDKERPKISLVPTAIIYDIAKIREYGIKKYGDRESWKDVEIERYFDAMLHHILPCFDDMEAKDKESGYPHLYHADCNLALILEMMECSGEDKKTNEKRGRCNLCKHSRQVTPEGIMCTYGGNAFKIVDSGATCNLYDAG